MQSPSSPSNNPNGLVGNLYEVSVLPNTASQLVEAVYKQKDLKRSEAREMAAYLDERYSMSDYVATSAAPKSAPTPVASNNKKPNSYLVTEEILKTGQTGNPVIDSVLKQGASNNLKDGLIEILKPEDGYGYMGTLGRNSAATQILNLILDTILASEEMQDIEGAGEPHNEPNNATPGMKWAWAQNAKVADLRAMLEEMRNG